MTSVAGASLGRACSVPSGSGKVNVGACVPRGSICDSTAGMIIFATRRDEQDIKYGECWSIAYVPLTGARKAVTKRFLVRS